MSENYQRRDVRSVSCSVLPVAMFGIILAARVLTPILSSLSKAAREVYRKNAAAASPNQAKIIKPLTTLRLENSPVQAGSHLLSQAEALKVSTLLAVSRSQCLIENGTEVYQKMEALRVAETPIAAQRAHKDLIGELESGHQRIFLKGLTLACTKAAIKAGFPSIQETSANGLMRIVATDRLGRALVTEIDGVGDREPRITTEVVGISDGSCTQIIDLFHKELEEQGIKSAPPKRKFTGGVCSMAAALEFIQRSVKPQPQNSITNSRNYSGERRIQRLNQRNRSKQTL